MTSKASNGANRIGPPVVTVPDVNATAAKAPRLREIEITEQQAAEYRAAEAQVQLAVAVQNALLRGIVLGHGITAGRAVRLQGTTLTLQVPDGE